MIPPPRRISQRTIIVVLHDMLASIVAWITGYWLRFNLNLPIDYYDDIALGLTLVVPIQAITFWRFGLYRGMWRFASLPDLHRILKAVGLAALVSPVALKLLGVDVIVPRSVLLIDPILLVLFMGGSRFVYRAWREHRIPELWRGNALPVFLAGAGSAADILLRDLNRHRGHWRVVGLLDDDAEKIGRHIQGLPVLGPLADLPAWADKLSVQDVVLALPGASTRLRRDLAERYATAGLNVLTVPSLEDMMAGRVAISQIRPIELDDLLGREPVVLDDAGLAGLLGGRSVFVSGAGGSIGSELCRQIARFRPARLILFDHSELALYQMEQEFLSRHPDQAIRCLVGDVKDRSRVAEAISEHLPDVIFHAAAYKHVPLMENDNAWQAVRNNIFGTYVVASEALRHRVAKFVLVSTDKAVNPTNVMGASKRAAEMVCQWLQGQGTTRFIAVRFGNVLGSSGSVVPKFQAQIACGGPITVTHPDITRYFMTIPEAAQLVLQAGLMGNGGEIFVLDMGEPVCITDLARLMIRLAGKSEAEIGIEYIGLRPGEKLYEELLADSETSLPTPHPKLRVAKARAIDSEMIEASLNWLDRDCCVDDSNVKRQLKLYVTEYCEQDGC